MLQWVAADLRTGRVLADLPGVAAQDPLRHSISNYDTATVTLSIGGAGSEWERATIPGGSVLACYDDADNTSTTMGPIRWAGYVNQRSRDATTSDLALSLVTIEGYFDRRFVGDVTWPGTTHRDDVIASVLTGYVAEGSDPGLPLQLVYTRLGGPTLGAQTVWLNSDNASVLSRLSEVIGLCGGEFTVGWSWTADNTGIYPTAYFGDRIGAAAAAGLGPPVLFEMPGSVAAATLVEDYSSGAGATKVVAYASTPSSSGTTPYSPPVKLPTVAGFRPTFEYRFSPAQRVGDATTLQQYATKALATLAPGGQALALTLSADPAASVTRKLGVDWQLGDDVGVNIAACDAFPAGYTATGRVIAYEVTDTTVTPVFADPTTYGG